jgi:hypothetical protein
MDSPPGSEPLDVKIPKKTKELVYYYRHRVQLLAKRLEKKLQDPEYVAKQQEKEKKRMAKEEEKELKRKEKEEKQKLKVAEKEEMKVAKRMAKMNALLGTPPGVI